VAPIFLTLGEVLEIHEDQIRRYGGAPGVRDIGLLQSAIAQPAAEFGGVRLHRDIFAMAAAYLFHIIQNHPLVDGNKRTGAVTALVFLSINDVHVKDAEEAAFEKLVRAVAEGRGDKTVVARFLQKHSRR